MTLDNAVNTAIKTAERITHRSTTELALALSLACYCSEDDASLTRMSFLQMIIDRIEMDLRDGTA